MKNTKHILIALLASLMYVSSAAQIRNVDIEAILESPQEGSEYPKGQPLPVKITLKNNGPDGLIVGDTVFCRMLIMDENMQPLASSGLAMIRITQNIETGEMLTIFEDGVDLEVEADVFNGNFCANILNPNTDGVSIGNDRVEVSYNDGTMENNIDCSFIQIGTSDPSSIENVNSHNGNLLVDVYPNPTRDRIYVKPAEYLSHGTLRVFNIAGTELFIQDNLNSSSLYIDMENYPAGIYFLEIKTESKIYRSKIVKE